MNKNIEVEGGEIAIRNSHGDLAIIPKDKRNWVKQKLSEGCHGCIDSLVETLPVASQYAQDGSVYPPNKKVKVNQDNQIKEYDISSPEYKDLYNSGKLTSYDKTSDTYTATPLKEVTVTAEAPQWLKYKREYEKTNPKSNYINQYLTPFAKSLGNTETNYPKRLDDEYEQKSLDYVSEQLVKNKPQGKLTRVEWLNQMSDKEEEIIKRNPKYQSSLWTDTKRGLTSLVEQNPLQTFQNILNSSDYSNREKREMLKDYVDHPIMSKLGDAAKILNPLSVPSKMVQSTYTDDYSFTDALKGKKNNAGIVEDIITDPLNLVGLGIWSKLSKVNKFAKIEDAYQAVKGLSKEEALSKLNGLSNNPNWNKYISQEEKVERILSKKDKIKQVTLPENQLSVEETFRGEDYKDLINLSKGKNDPGMTYNSFEEAAKNWASKRNDDLAGSIDNLGKAQHNNYWGISKDFKGIPEDADRIRKTAYEKYYKNATPKQRVIIQEHIKNHELDHFLYKQSRAEYDELIKAFNPVNFGLSKKYLIGKKSTIAGDEIRARMGQLMDYFQFKHNPKTGNVEDVLGNTKFTNEHLDYALKNYIKDTGLDNNMVDFFNGITNKNLFVKMMNNKALSTIPVYLYLQSQQNKSEQ